MLKTAPTPLLFIMRTSLLLLSFLPQLASAQIPN